MYQNHRQQRGGGNNFNNRGGGNNFNNRGRGNNRQHPYSRNNNTNNDGSGGAYNNPLNLFGRQNASNSAPLSCVPAHLLASATKEEQESKQLQAYVDKSKFWQKQLQTPEFKATITVQVDRVLRLDLPVKWQDFPNIAGDASALQTKLQAWSEDLTESLVDKLTQHCAEEENKATEAWAKLKNDGLNASKH